MIRWKLPKGLLPRIRTIFLAYGLFNAFLLIPQFMFQSTPIALRLLGLLGVGVITWFSIKGYRAGRLSLLGDVLVAVAIGVEAVVLGSFVSSVAILYVTLQNHGMYDSGRRVALRSTMFAVAYGIGISTVPEGAAALTSVLTQIPNLVINAAVMHLLSAALQRQEVASSHQEALVVIGASLVAAVTPEHMWGATTSGVLEVLPKSDHARVVISVGVPGSMRIVAAAGENLPPIGSPSLFDIFPEDQRNDLIAGRQVRVRSAKFGPTPFAINRSAIITPLMNKGTLRGILVVSGENVIDTAIDEMLFAVAVQLSLALEGDALREDLLARRSEGRARSVVQNSSDLILIVDAAGEIHFQNPSVTSVLGHDVASLQGRSVRSLIHPDDVARFDEILTDVKRKSGATATMRARWMHSDGSEVVGDSAVSNLLDDPQVAGVVFNTRDVTSETRLQEELRQQAFHDSLTQLANRALFEDRVQHAIARADRQGRSLAVLFLDVDDFKTVNDSLGHHAGDEFLVAVGERLGLAVRDSDTVARFGGDEFAVLLEDVETPAEAAIVGERIQLELAKPLKLQGRTLTISASIGVAVREAHQSPSHDVLRDADLAMYAAKANGKGRQEIFHSGMRGPAVDRLHLESDMRAALLAEEFFVEYQPIVRLADGSIRGVEALARWNHVTRGSVPPSQFIPIAEETGLIVGIGRSILRQALRDCRRWSQGRTEPIGVSVNFSARQFQAPTLVDDVVAALHAAHVDPGLLTIEITESVLMRDAATSAEKLKQLHDLGVRIAIDDFGTGYSSLSYLHRFPTQELKVDRSFVELLHGRGDDPALPKAIVALGKSMGLVTVAEGIETREQLEALRALGCEMGQGYYFARPQSFDKLTELLRLPIPLSARPLALPASPSQRTSAWDAAAVR